LGAFLDYIWIGTRKRNIGSPKLINGHVELGEGALANHPCIANPWVFSINLSAWLAIILIPFLLHLAMVLSGYLYYKLHGCPRTSYSGRRHVYARDRRVIISGEIVYTSANNSSTIYLVKGRVLPLSFLLNPILLCIFTYFSPIKLANGVYEAYGAM
jgi:hypothetical protein